MHNVTLPSPNLCGVVLRTHCRPTSKVHWAHLLTRLITHPTALSCPILGGICFVVNTLTLEVNGTHSSRLPYFDKHSSYEQNFLDLVLFLYPSIDTLTRFYTLVCPSGRCNITLTTTVYIIFCSHSPENQKKRFKKSPQLSETWVSLVEVFVRWNTRSVTIHLPFCWCQRQLISMHYCL